MRINKALSCLIILFSLFYIMNLSYAAPSVDTELSRDKIAMGETITISFILNSNSSVASPDFSVLEKDFRILSTNYGKSFNIVNGVTTTQTFWQLTLEPKNAGEIIIPEVNFGQVKSAPRKLWVDETTPTNRNDKDDVNAFVQAEVSNTSPYIQSQVLYTFKLFYQSQLENPRIHIPQMKDITFVQLGEGKEYETTVKGKPFFVVEKTFAFFPQKSGKIFIPSSHFRALTYDYKGSNLSMMDDPFYFTTPHDLSLTTQAFTLAVKQIPDNYQGKTWLPAKAISLTEKWSLLPDQWELGNPVTRTITIEAEGLRADQIPSLSFDTISGINMYVDPPKRSNKIQDNTVMGKLEQRVTYIPSASQSFAIPALTINWWNTETNTNAVSQLHSINAQVKGKNNTTASTLANSLPVKQTDTVNAISDPRSQHSVSIKNESETNIKTTPFYLSIWFWIAIFSFVIWVITLGLVWIKRSVKNINLNSLEKDKYFGDTSLEISEKHFEQACDDGNTALAQQFLLRWAKKEWRGTPLNLEKLREMISDENFKNALKNLEEAIYAKKEVPWNGHALFTAYNQVKKHNKYALSNLAKTNNVKEKELDPLPPLNPKY